MVEVVAVRKLEGVAGGWRVVRSLARQTPYRILCCWVLVGAACVFTCVCVCLARNQDLKEPSVGKLEHALSCRLQRM